MDPRGVHRRRRLTPLRPHRLRNRNTVEFLGVWERVHNPGFNYGDFTTIRGEAGLNAYRISVKDWVEKTGAIGLRATAGRYGGTYAHPDIAFEFAMWISPEFKVYLVQEFRRLKTDEAALESREWSFQRTLAKVNYRIHTDAIQEHLIPPELTKAQIHFVYASEADVLNAALFGRTAAEWRKQNPKLQGNMRDHATLEQLVVLSLAGRCRGARRACHADRVPPLEARTSQDGSRGPSKTIREGGWVRNGHWR